MRRRASNPVARDVSPLPVARKAPNCSSSCRRKAPRHKNAAGVNPPGARAPSAGVARALFPRLPPPGQPWRMRNRRTQSELARTEEQTKRNAQTNRLRTFRSSVGSPLGIRAGSALCFDSDEPTPRNQENRWAQQKTRRCRTRRERCRLTYAGLPGSQQHQCHETREAPTPRGHVRDD